MLCLQAIDVAMKRAGRSLEATKGYHFPGGGAYVEYDGTEDSLPQLVVELNAALAAITSESIPTHTRTDPATGDRIASSQRDRVYHNLPPHSHLPRTEQRGETSLECNARETRSSFPGQRCRRGLPVRRDARQDDRRTGPRRRDQSEEQVEEIASLVHCGVIIFRHPLCYYQYCSTVLLSDSHSDSTADGTGLPGWATKVTITRL